MKPMKPMKPWLPAALSLMLVGWGANQFAALMTLYRVEHGFTELAVASMLGIYVLGLMPGLLVGGPLSDRIGRRSLTLLAVVLSLFASFVMAFGGLAAEAIYAGRLIAGVATGIAMAATTGWIKELSQPPYDLHASAGAGARRSSLLMATGFLIGPVISAVLAQVAPLPEVLPYVLHILLLAPFLILVRRLPETLQRRTRSSIPAGWRASSARHPRFSRVVGPVAPWAFAASTIGYAVVPLLSEQPGTGQLPYAAGVVTLTLGAGLLVQTVARRLDTAESGRGILTALLVTLVGLLMAFLAAVMQDPWVGAAAAAALGAGYGLAFVTGLLEVQRIAPPQELGALTGIYYSIVYIGFLTPTVLAFLGNWFDRKSLILAVAVLCLGSVVSVLINYRRHLPSYGNFREQGRSRGKVLQPAGKEHRDSRMLPRRRTVRFHRK